MSYDADSIIMYFDRWMGLTGDLSENDTADFIQNKAAVIVLEDVAVTEGSDTGALKVRLEHPPAENMTLILSTTNPASSSNATAPADYARLVNFLVTVPAGATHFDIPLNIVDDSEIEGTELFGARIVSSSNLAQGRRLVRNEAVVTLIDNDLGDGDFNLDPNKEPWENFDLEDWVIDTPAFASDGESQRFGEDEWDEISDESRNFFMTHTDGGMRFISTVGGARTSQNTSFVRSELREMLRRGDTSARTQGVTPNNWALGYQPAGGNYGGRNGVLRATLRVDEVTSTGNGLHPGRVIIGQIHADNDEPIRLYYRKLPGAARGCIYAESEIRDGNDVEFDLIGDERCSGNGPSNGIALGELFSYEIINEDEDIIVTVRRGDLNRPIIASTTIDLIQLNSGYDRSDEWMYFKAGAYTQNSTGDPNDRDVITFYRLTNTHDPN